MDGLLSFKLWPYFFSESKPDYELVRIAQIKLFIPLMAVCVVYYKMFSWVICSSASIFFSYGTLLEDANSSEKFETCTIMKNWHTLQKLVKTSRVLNYW